MGNRHDVVASDLDAAYSRRNARRQSCHRKGDVDECRFGSRTRIHHRTEHLLQYGGQFERSSGWTIVSRAGRTARSGSRLRESNAATARQVSGRFRSADLLRLRGARRTGYATPNDTSLSKQLEAAGILEKLWKQNANHPGVVHYLIHSYDYPQFAQRGLTAAQTYNSIAPWVPHALHMPSHIFTRLGMWDESIAANRASAEASRAYAAMRHRDAAEAEELHALDYMAYSYLQEAQDAEAKKIVDIAAKVKKTNPELEFSAAYALAAIPTRYAFERNDWAAAANLSIPNLPHWSSFPFMEALIEYGHALGRAHTGDVEGARKAIARMQQLRDATKEPKFDYFKSHLDLQMQAASAWVAAAEGKKNEAIDMLRRAADSEDILGKHPVSPGAFVPIREQLGTLLLEMGQPTEAQREFEAALKIYPGRFRGLYGAAQAAELAGDNQGASRYYTKLAAQTSKAGGSRDELNHVREFLSAQAKAADSKGVASARE